MAGTLFQRLWPNVGRMAGPRSGRLAGLVAAVLAPMSDAAAQVVGPPAPIAAGRPSVPSSATGAEGDADAGLFDDQRVGRGGSEEDRVFRFDSRLDVEVEGLDQGNLRDGGGRDVARLLSEVRLELTYRPAETLEAFASFEIGKPFEREDGAWSSFERIELREAYLTFKDAVVEDVEVQVGRQGFEDGREWLYDDRLDALRIAYDEDGLRVEAAIGRVGLAPVNLLDADRSGRTDNFLLRAEYEVSGDWDAAAYVLAQEDRTAADISPTFYGVQSEGTLFGALSHWLELSVQRGHAANARLRANAVDAGLIYRFAGALRPTLVVGYARGSGGGGGGNRPVDRDFRQTGLQDNEDRLTGLGNVTYYGELLAPSLSNLSILTLGVGLRPGKSTSLEIVAHRYRQVALGDDAVRDSPFDARPGGTSRGLGTGVDLIAAFRLSRFAGLEGKLGYFDPGRAFKSGTDDAVFFNTRLVYNF